MAFIPYLPTTAIAEQDRVADNDNILRIHGVNSPIMRQHFALYRQLMYGLGPLSRLQREMIAVVVSAKNNCHY